MRLALDLRAAAPGSSGIGRYAAAIAAELDRIATDHALMAIVRPGAAKNWTLSRVEPIAFDASELSVRTQLALPGLLRRIGADVFHAPYVTAPLLARCPVVITVHDLIPQLFRRELARSTKARLGWLWPLWCRAQYRKAARIITVSEHSKRDLARVGHVTEARIRAIHNGVAPQPAPASAEIAALRSRYGWRGRIVSYVGRRDPYKNLGTLIRAFATVARESPEPVHLVIAGERDPRYPEPEALARELGLEARISFPGYLDEADRVTLVAASDVFCFPSRYEGFGLPPLEAMALGTPVVASSAASLPEVVGDAALSVDPGDTAGFARAILALLGDEALAIDLAERGRARAAKFTWRRSAEAHLRVFEELARRGS